MTTVGNSLQDQLLKAGLVNEQKLRQTKTAKRKKNRQTNGAAQGEQLRRAQQAAADKAKSDRALNREREEAAKRKAEEHELRQLIHAHRVLRGKGDVAFNFQDGAALKRIYMTADQQRDLVRGRLALVRQDANYELLLPDIAEKVRARKAELVLVLNKEEQDADFTGDEGDPYANYKVPDDLMW